MFDEKIDARAPRYEKTASRRFGVGGPGTQASYSAHPSAVNRHCVKTLTFFEREN